MRIPPWRNGAPTSPYQTAAVGRIFWEPWWRGRDRAAEGRDPARPYPAKWRHFIKYFYAGEKEPVLGMVQQIVGNGTSSAWAVCVQYMDSPPRRDVV
jgi:hypothetical protein